MAVYISVTGSSPRTNSTYLFEQEETISTQSNQKVKVRPLDGTLPTSRHDSLITPYITTVLGSGM